MKDKCITLAKIFIPLLSMSVSAVTAQAAPESAPLFMEVSEASRVEETISVHAVRRRAVRIDMARLSEIHANEAGTFTFNLFDDATLSATVERVATHVEGYSLRGRLDGDSQGQFNLVVHGDAVVGTLRTESMGTYRIRSIDGQNHYVEQIDTGSFPPCSTTSESMERIHDEMADRLELERAESGVAAIKSATASVGSPSLDDGTVLDILVLYSNVTRQAAGGTSAIRAVIQLSVDVANDAYAASGINTRLRLVHMDEVIYDEVTGFDGFEDHLVRLWGKTDGDYDEAHVLRDFYGADLISLIVEDSTGPTFGSKTCGIGYVMNDFSVEFESAALSVVNRECAADNWTFAHEIGHNQGCAHNREDAGIEGLYSYSYGHRYSGGTDDWRTIMAYDGPAEWTRIGYFSNPNVSYDGGATGVTIGAANEAHNALTIQNTRVTVARFRITRYWVDLDWRGTENGLFDNPYNNFIEGLNAVPDGGMVVVKSGSYNSPIVLSKPLKINSINGSMIIGQAHP